MTLSFLLAQWSFRPVVVGLLLATAVFYGRGWPLYRAAREHYTAVLENSIDTPRYSKPRLFYASLLVAAVALLSPVNYLSTQLFFMRVGQHLLLMSLFPALFMHSNPWPVLKLGLPQGWLRALRGRVHPGTALYGWVQALTTKGVMWFLFVAAVWLWYDPTLHALTLQYAAVRHIELTSLVVLGLFHWWHITGASPRLHSKLPSLAHIGYTLAGAAPLKIPGLFLLFSVHNSFPYPTQTILGWTIDPLTSQQIGGILVWVLGGTVYSTTALRFLSQWFDLEEQKPERPRHLWDNHEAMLAPGVQKREP